MIMTEEMRKEPFLLLDLAQSVNMSLAEDNDDEVPYV